MFTRDDLQSLREIIALAANKIVYAECYLEIQNASIAVDKLTKLLEMQSKVQEETKKE